MVVLLNQIVSGAFCAFVAGEKNRSPTNWFWLGFCFGPFPIAMLALAALPTLATRPTWMDDRTHPTDRPLAALPALPIRPIRDFGLQPRSPENIVLNWVEIEPGNFCMGDGSRAVAVTLTSPFRLGQTQITMLQWVSVMGTKPWMTRWETSKYTDPMPDGTARIFTFEIDAKSVITSPCYPNTIPSHGWRSVNGLAWSGRGRITRVEVSVDGGTTWHDAELLEGLLPPAKELVTLAVTFKLALRVDCE